MAFVVEQMEKNFLEDPFPPAVKEAFLQNDPKSFSAANTNPWLDVAHKLPLIDKPTFLICGEKSAELPELELAAQLIKGAKIKVLPGLNHVETYWGGEHVEPGIGGLVSTYEIPNKLQTVYGSHPISYMLFVRMQLA